jgi:hypothetical protein
MCSLDGVEGPAKDRFWLARFARAFRTLEFVEQRGVEIGSSLALYTYYTHKLT